MSDFLKTVTEGFKRLLNRRRLKVESSEQDAQAFGNAVVVLAGGNLRIRMTRDRGDILADAASPQEPDNWFPLQRVVRAVGISPAPLEGLLEPKQAAAIVEQYLVELEHGLGERRFPRTKMALTELERQALERPLYRAKAGAR